MKSSVAKLLRTIFIVAAALLLIATAVLYFVETPVVEEGVEPTTAQRILLLGKEYLSEILMASGVSVVGVIGVLTKLIYNSAKATFNNSALTSTEIAALRQENESLRTSLAEQMVALGKLAMKQDIANTALLNTFQLSEMPATVRQQIYEALNAYKALEGQTTAATVPTTNDSTHLETPAETTEEPEQETTAATPAAAPVLL